YSKDTFDINFPCLVLEQDIVEEWQVRYYKTPIVYQGTSYKLCSQWVERNRLYLKKWIEQHVNFSNPLLSPKPTILENNWKRK
ncbi:MAG: hypothetical protein MJY45_02660, partial [Bacteroidales bacterium]|nr:hypothetical protein [Bacteroidales bacterium]